MWGVLEGLRFRFGSYTVMLAWSTRASWSKLANKSRPVSLVNAFPGHHCRQVISLTVRKDERVQFLASLQVTGSQGEVKSFREVAGEGWHFFMKPCQVLRKRKPVFCARTPGAPGPTGDLPASRQELWISKIPDDPVGSGAKIARKQFYQEKSPAHVGKGEQNLVWFR